MSLKKLLFNKISGIIILIILSVISIFIGVHDFTKDIFILTRIPRLLSIIITGSSLAISGVIMQAITKNKFVSPSTAGTMEWSRFGVMLAIVFFQGASSSTKIFVAFSTSLGGSILFMILLSKIKIKDVVMVPLIGMMFGSVVSSITTFFSYKYDVIQNISSWLLGSFSSVIKGRYEILYIGIPFLIISYIYADKFTITGMGEEIAKGLGINYKVIVMIGLIIVSIISSTVTVAIGTLPFIGLIVPNIVSMYRGDNIKKNIFDTALLGAIFVLACDIFSRILIFPYEVSVSLTISVVGSLIFLILIFRRNKDA